LAGVALAQKAVKPDRISGFVNAADKGKTTIEMRMRTNAVVRQIMYDANANSHRGESRARRTISRKIFRIVALGKFEEDYHHEKPGRSGRS
jgi:hypothetical protein